MTKKSHNLERVKGGETEKGGRTLSLGSYWDGANPGNSNPHNGEGGVERVGWEENTPKSTELESKTVCGELT